MDSTLEECSFWPPHAGELLLKGSVPDLRYVSASHIRVCAGCGPPFTLVHLFQPETPTADRLAFTTRNQDYLPR